ncbi:cyclophilin-like fold protein [Furfurilactobacillus milii]|uniref:Cyclophilin-like domain-containing protein n=1 Tax=Furfurilactobacillus milii TaxID=2888272 RepID=A0A6N9I2U2_9LACO|nr:hypothetical protein [Furfurilactobacillus milii]
MIGNVSLQTCKQGYEFELIENNLSESFYHLLPVFIDLYVGQDTRYWGYLPRKLNIENLPKIVMPPRRGLYYVPSLQTVTIYYRDAISEPANDLYLLGRPKKNLETLAQQANDIVIRAEFKF